MESLTRLRGREGCFCTLGLMSMRRIFLVEARLIGILNKFICQHGNHATVNLTGCLHGVIVWSMNLQQQPRKRTVRLFKGEMYIPVQGAELRRLRIEANVSQDEAAKYLGCNKSQVSRWEHETQTPSQVRMVAYVEYLRRKKDRRQRRDLRRSRKEGQQGSVSV